MPYDPRMIQPMKDELTKHGIQELLTEADVKNFLSPDQKGTAMVIINSVCGCAAGGARPGAVMALRHECKPERVATVFAGQDTEAVAAVRNHMPEVPPSSPSMAIFRDGKLVHYLPRHQIEGRDAQNIAFGLVEAFDLHCTNSGAKK